MNKSKWVNSKYKQIKLINILFGQSFLILFLAIFQFNNHLIDIFYLYQFITVIFISTTFFLVVKINYLAQKEAEARAYQVKLEENQQLVQFFETQIYDFLQYLDNFQILINYSNYEVIKSYLTQVRREHENLLEIVKLEVPQYIAAIIKKVHEAQAHFIYLCFHINTDLKNLSVSLDDFETGLACLQAVWIKQIDRIPLEKRNIKLLVDLEGNHYLVEVVYYWPVNRLCPEVEKSFEALRLIAAKNQAVVNVSFDKEKTIITILIPKGYPKKDEKGQNSEVEHV